ncbi:hypothetical protein KP79_PYT05729 [Mizuhopecten yessoensis]|uniref:Uncharacterized protein n=1 Tax=Mizuhopecten yessoensis TaxID=6573 RepID=A0A210QM50_MIZYE|nr:hypothetical protein KP79_PYT05729 [Mizuhopecten yessoensis]
MYVDLVQREHLDCLTDLSCSSNILEQIVDTENIGLSRERSSSYVVVKIL